jgi:hypothetical protein
MREIRCLTDAFDQYRAVLDHADAIADSYHPSPAPLDPGDEIARRLPNMLATLSPAARALMREQVETMGLAAAAMADMFGTGRGPHLQVVSG